LGKGYAFFVSFVVSFPTTLFMQTLTLPTTDIALSQLCLGTMSAGVQMDEPTTHALLDHYRAAGGNFVDTARIYADWMPGEKGRGERILGDWLAQGGGRREAVFLATKGCHMPLDARHIKRVSREAMQEDLEQSLTALRLENVDLWYFHRDDPAQPVETIIDFANEFVRAGKVRFLGASNWSGQRLAEANAYARASGQAGFVVSQPQWNAGTDHIKPNPDDTVHVWQAQDAVWHRAAQTIVAPYSAQASGWFSKITSPDPAVRAKAEGSHYDTPANRHRATVMQTLAQGHGVPISHVALAYLTSQPIPVAPIVGIYNQAQLDDALAAAKLRLTPEEVAQIEASA